MGEDPHSTLVESACRGEAHAIEALLERHLPGLRAYVRLHASSLIREKESCSDLVQSVCREVLEDVERFEYRGEAQFRSWLFTQAMGKIVSRQRFYLAEKRSPQRELPLAPASGGDGVRDVYATFCSPSQVAIGHEDMDRLERAFDQLPEDYKKVITQARLLGLSHAEIAAEMGRNEGAVRVLLHRALVRLGRIMTRAEDT